MKILLAAMLGLVASCSNFEIGLTAGEINKKDRNSDDREALWLTLTYVPGRAAMYAAMERTALATERLTKHVVPEASAEEAKEETPKDPKPADPPGGKTVGLWEKLHLAVYGLAVAVIGGLGVVWKGAVGAFVKRLKFWGSKADPDPD